MRNRISLLNIKEQTPEICLAAVKDNVLLEAIKQNVTNFLKIPNPTEEMCITAIKINPSNKLCELAVRRCPAMLEYIENQTDKICMIALKKISKLSNI